MDRLLHIKAFAAQLYEQVASVQHMHDFSLTRILVSRALKWQHAKVLHDCLSCMRKRSCGFFLHGIKIAAFGTVKGESAHLPLFQEDVCVPNSRIITL